MILEQLDIEQYHLAEYVSSSKLGTYLHHGPRAYWLRYVRSQRAQSPRTAAQDIGQAFEDAVNGRPRHVFVPPDLKVASNGALSTKEAKAWKAEQEAAGRVVLGESDRDLFTHGIDHLRANPVARELIDTSTEQLTVRADYPGLPGVQARPDWLSLAGCAASDWAPVAPDLKTTTDLRAFCHAISRYGYHRQAAMVDLCLADDGVPEGDVRHPLIVVEKCFPYRCQVMWLSPRYVAIGSGQCVTGLDALTEHYGSGRWPTVTEDAVAVEPPAWMCAQEGADEESDT